MVNYEFTEEQSKLISSINLRITLIGILNIISAVATWFISASQLNLGFMINGVVTIIIALAFIIPIQDLVRVVNSPDSDVNDLMSSFKRINLGWLVFIIGFMYLRIYDYFQLS